MSYILEDDQLEEIWNKADCSRGDQAYLRDEIFDLVNTVNHYKQLAEERGKALEWYADEANHATSDDDFFEPPAIFKDGGNRARQTLGKEQNT